MCLLQILLAITTSALAASKEDYCAICADHTMCVYPGVSPKCNGAISGVSADQKSVIVDRHNYLRNRVASGKETRGNPGPQPSASDMNKLVWDDELQTIAQRWADQCIYTHDACRNTYKYGAVGQNIARSTSYNVTPNWKEIIDLWYSEVDQFSNDGVDHYVSRPYTQHYSQVVSAETEGIGCVKITVYGDNFYRERVYLCNYGPSGNWSGQDIYSRGVPRENCSSSPMDRNYPALCGLITTRNKFN